ncbi:hypothetical protein BGZ90_006745 [Linnemannia elongata]|nr:hypothetical protein BGZ90_006745 [Linnemannia elongata]
MENSPSGLVTPPLVSPRPIQSQKSSSSSSENNNNSNNSGSSNWKVVGSPPRRPLLSPPEERERHRVLLEADTTTVEATYNNRPIATTTTILPADTPDLADSTLSSMSASIITESSSSSSSASSISNPASPTMPQYKQGLPRIHTGKEMSTTSYQTAHSGSSNTQQGLFYAVGGPISPFARDSFTDDSTPQSMHFKSSSTGSLGSAALDSLTFHSLLGEQGPSLLSAHSLGREAGVKRGSLKHNGNALESPLAMSSFAWDGQVSRESSNTPTAHNRTSNRASAPVDSLPSLGSPLDGRSAYYSLHMQTSHLSNDSDAGIPKTTRSMSFSEPSFSSAFGLGTTKSGYDQDDEDVLRYRPPLATMDEELEDPMEAPRMARTRSFSTSAALGSSVFPGGLSTSLFPNPGTQDPFGVSTGPLGGSALAMGNDAVAQLNRRLSGAGVAWPSSSGPDILPLNHRRSITSTSGYSAPIWESSGPFQPLSPTSERERQQDRQLIARRFSVAPSSGLQNYDAFLDEAESGSHSALASFNRYPQDADAIQQSPRRHSVAVPGGSYLRSKTASFDLTSSFDGLRLDDSERNSGHGWSASDGLLEEDEHQGDVGNTKDLGKGLSLGQLPHRGSLYMVEFKAGRSDLFYTSENSGLNLKTGDLVMVEADRGKDLGKITNDYITPQQIQALQAQQAENAALQAQQDGGNGGHRAPKEIHPKRIFGLAQSSEIAQLVSKNQDEIEAMIMCQTKVRQKRLPMEVVNAEYQWDRRKLTFYFTAEKRIDFRELVRDLFKMYKTRIWMYALSPSMANNSSIGPQSSSPPPTPTAHQHPHQHHQQQRQHHLTRHQVNSTGGISSPTSPRALPTPKTPLSPYYASPYGNHYPTQPSYPQYPQVPTGFQPQQQHHQNRQHHMPTQFSPQQVFSPHSHYQHHQQHHHFSFAPPTSP